jgi:hypothetical protein
LYDGEKFQQAEKSAGSGMGVFFAEFGSVPAPMFRKSGPQPIRLPDESDLLLAPPAFGLLFAVHGNL